MTTDTAVKTTRLADYVAEGLIASIGRYASYSGTTNTGGYVKFRKFFAEGQTAEAQAWAAQFPKSNKVRVTTCSGSDDNFYPGKPFGEGIVKVSKFTGQELVRGDANYYTDASWSAPYVTVEFKFVANGVTGDKNESAAKRLRSFLKNLDKLGISYTEGDKVGGAITMAELLTEYA
jgi:hypothetical protein